MVEAFQDFSDLTNDLFPACTTTSSSCHNSATFPAMIARQDVVHQPVDTLPFPSLSDLEMVQTTMESSVDPVSFLLEMEDEESIDGSVTGMSHKSMDVIGISCGIACDISSVISFCSIVMLVI
jgi:hypothetical protein